MVSRKCLASLAMVFCVGAAHAVPVHVTHVFDDVGWIDHGIANGLSFGKVVTGDWIFKAIFDSEAPNVSEGSNDINGAWAVSHVTLTQASLGLFDAEITNLPFLNYQGMSVGLGNVAHQGIYPTAVGQVPDRYPAFPPRSPFSDGYAPVTMASGRVSSREEGFLFADGSRLYGEGFAVTSTFGAAVAPVPEPETWLAMMAGLGVLVGRFAKKRAASQPAMAAA